MSPKSPVFLWDSSTETHQTPKTKLIEIPPRQSERFGHFKLNSIEPPNVRHGRFPTGPQSGLYRTPFGRKQRPREVWRGQGILQTPCIYRYRTRATPNVQVRHTASTYGDPRSQSCADSRGLWWPLSSCEQCREENCFPRFMPRSVGVVISFRPGSK